MLQFINNFIHSVWYWLAVIAMGIFMEGVALFYQYGLGEWPCVLCIQARFWVMTGILFAIIGAIARNNVIGRLTAQVGLIGAIVMLTIRSNTTVLVERGLYEGSCGMDAGFPDWFALDKWFPAMFEVQTMCGYTPNFLFGMSMGEGLLYAAIALLLVALLALGFMVFQLFQKPQQA